MQSIMTVLGGRAGYYNNEGKVTTGKTLDSIAWRAPLKFFKHLRKLRNEGRCFEGMQVV